MINITVSPQRFTFKTFLYKKIIFCPVMSSCIETVNIHRRRVFLSIRYGHTLIIAVYDYWSHFYSFDVYVY